MKKTILYLGMITIVATALYYGSYRYFYGFSDEAETALDNIKKAPEDENRTRELLEAFLGREDMGDSAQAMQEEEATVNRQTQVTMEYYDKTTGESTYSKEYGNTEFLGYTREEIVQHTKEYMNNMSFEDQEKGLYDYQLLSFGDNKITLRKSYEKKKKENEPKYYVGLLDYYVAVYHNEEPRILYEVTDIDSRNLPSKLANQLSQGMYFFDEYDLYNFLEAYSS